MRKKVLIITEYQINRGEGAAYERVKCYAKAVPDVDFVCLPPDNNYRNNYNLTIHEGTSNLFFISNKEITRGFLYRNLIKYFDVYHPYMLCVFIQRYYSDSKILLYSSNLFLFWFILKMLKQHNNFDIIVEKNEIETAIVINSDVPQGIKRLFFYLFFPYRYVSAWLIDQMTPKATTIIVISENINQKYISSGKSCYIPILVDMDRFNDVQGKTHTNGTKFIYLGSITLNKDALLQILKSIDRLSKRFYDFSVDIIGGGSMHDIRIIEDLIHSRKIESLVSIRPQVKSSKVPALLNKYDFSFLLRELNAQTHYGFSTKLGEYLAAGLPVIYTNVSDNSIYLKDTVHGYIVPHPIEDNLDHIIEKAIKSTYEERQVMKARSLELAKSAFALQNYYSKLNSIFS